MGSRWWQRIQEDPKCGPVEVAHALDEAVEAAKRINARIDEIVTRIQEGGVP